MTFNDFVKTYLGKYIDYDGVYGVQCVDLAKLYIKKVLNIEPESIGNAIEYFNKRNTSNYLKKNFKWIDNTPSFIPKLGDLGIFTTSSGNGHIVVCTGVGTTSWFNTYEENTNGKGSCMQLVKRTYKNFLGVLRPINQKPLLIDDSNSFITNASITKDCDTYCDSDFKNKIGSVCKDERVRVLGITETNSFIQYTTRDKKYKIGIVKSKYVNND